MTNLSSEPLVKLDSNSTQVCDALLDDLPQVLVASDDGLCRVKFNRFPLWSEHSGQILIGCWRARQQPVKICSLCYIIHEIWKSQAVPTIRKKACTILIHKNLDTSDPSSFRPITLQSVPLNIFTSSFKYIHIVL